ncbi:NAD(P)-dependent dehydrogenase (short-subunit alcohol dehydrogenase family) [Lewinella aquimaris]|uniref:NAD(P)-dependent dehydrogenase (Short-subunit alcohol dehydrogenase family) n=1 Tax=Neolewinella aquimaris TaxID=1835722 RepID=A0A840DWN7_9BACT|nr:3-ketoacyl-ACP reductase [Neolewinella aquimaris]MBB4077614.1 NAD(P)-dependent dehydrogenase (short-subunit alcohol dehydrogenase family) [Neolewinella aquimaris]
MTNAEHQPSAFVTGGSRGIGLGIARALATAGYALAINGMRPETEVGDVLAELRALTDQAVHYVQGNIGYDADRERMVDEVYTHFGQLHVLINNAGVAPRERADVLDMKSESYDRVLEINLRGPFFLTQAIAKRMVADRRDRDTFSGCIINVGSISATVASISRAEYCVSKAGIGMMTRLFATRLAPEGIPVYELRPGIIRTDMTQGVTEKYDRLIADGITLQPRWGYPEDVGRAVSALVRGDFPYSTGQVIMIDGGLTLPRL